jgi:hypothetical protein
LFLLAEVGISRWDGDSDSGTGAAAWAADGEIGLYFDGWYLPMGTAKISGLGMPLSTVDWGSVRPALEGDETMDDVLDMVGDGGVESVFLRKGCGLYCLVRGSWLGK